MYDYLKEQQARIRHIRIVAIPWRDNSEYDKPMSNKNTYNKKSVADYYSKEDKLQPPEAAILESIKERLPQMKMLDIGVGGGRTTLHFAEHTEEYVGVDYSEEMVAVCKRRFSGWSNKIAFAVCDARNMQMFEDDRFDFILFSFNGIDSIAYEDRDRVLREVQRVGKQGGWFAFSTHNLLGAPELFKFHGFRGRSLVGAGKSAVKWVLLNFICNKPKDVRDLPHKQYAIINDGCHGFNLKNCYIRPSEQIDRLQEGFENIRVFSLAGNEVNDSGELNSIKHSWLYYLCTIK